MKKRIILLSIFMLSGCLSLNTSTNSNSSNSSSNSSFIIDGDLVAKKLIIDSSNYNSLKNVEIKNVIDNIDGKEELFTFNANGEMKIKNLTHISEVSIRVFQTFNSLNVYPNFDCSGNSIESKKVSGNREATYTYELNNVNELTIKNVNSTYKIHVYEISVNYYVIENNQGGSSSSSSSVSSNTTTNSTSSTTSNSKPSSSSSSSNNENNDGLKQGLTGKEWLEYYGSENGPSCKSVPSTGNPKMLVVPVMFKNETISNSSQTLKDIKTVFNGTSSETSWESVDTFYKKSSYNQLDMDIEVLDYWITLDKTCNNMLQLDQNTYYDPTWYALEYVVKQLKNKGFNMKDYDTNSDGFIDGIWMVYGKNYSSATTDEMQDFLWAYTYWKHNNVKNINNPVANVYAWASIEFMYEGNYSKPDAHTFIHETGHMLGLDDYYNYDYNENEPIDLTNPAGCLDMMDQNIGDHNSYSKYLLDWVSPYYVTEKSTFTIKPFESSGECIVVPSNLNNPKSPLDEYLIIEYYTPTGLNESDSKTKYNGYYPLMFTESGIKIYHIDSRIGEFISTYEGEEFGNYLDEVTYDNLVNGSNGNTYYDIFASNTPSWSYDGDYKKLTLLSSQQKSKKGYYYSGTNATNADLYQTGDSVNSYIFNNGKSLIFKITIESLTSNSATISFQ